MYLGRRGGDGKAIDGASSGVGLQQGGKDLDESGFAGTVGAKQGENAACGNLTVDTAQPLRALVRLVHARTWIMGAGAFMAPAPAPPPARSMYSAGPAPS